MHEDTGLPASRPGHHEQVADGRGNRLPLAFVQTVEDVGNVHQPKPFKLDMWTVYPLGLVIASE